MAEVERSDDGAIRTLTLNRPDARNALNLSLLKGFRAELRATRDAPSVRCVVVTGAGRGFSAGADVKEWAEVAAKGVADYGWVEETHAMIEELATLPIPTIAWLNGTAVGAGLDMALACDFRFAAEDAKFTCAYTRMAYNPDAGGTWFLPRIIGLAEAKRFIFTGDPWSAAEALARGLVTEVLPSATLGDAVRAFAAKLAAGPTVAIRQGKALLDTAHTRSLREQLAAERKAGDICGESQDAGEAITAAIAKRAPNFVGA
ncbi:MAG: enoyl-CoA hydratase/isomerase family protein [Alphaproteobacteria bacterium]|nr:enoyl-CoA hydratase/isomerase family protein [Alphaproteobacteria bacterium]